MPICRISVEPAGCQHKMARPAAIWQTVEILQQPATRNQQIRKVLGLSPTAQVAHACRRGGRGTAGRPAITLFNYQCCTMFGDTPAVQSAEAPRVRPGADRRRPHRRPPRPSSAATSNAACNPTGRGAAGCFARYATIVGDCAQGGRRIAADTAERLPRGDVNGDPEVPSARGSVSPHHAPPPPHWPHAAAGRWRRQTVRSAQIGQRAPPRQ